MKDRVYSEHSYDLGPIYDPPVENNQEEQASFSTRRSKTIWWSIILVAQSCCMLRRRMRVSLSGEFLRISGSARYLKSVFKRNPRPQLCEQTNGVGCVVKLYWAEKPNPEDEEIWGRINEFVAGIRQEPLAGNPLPQRQRLNNTAGISIMHKIK